MSTCRNKEGYWDRVAGQAIREGGKKEGKAEERVNPSNATNREHSRVRNRRDKIEG